MLVGYAGMAKDEVLRETSNGKVDVCELFKHWTPFVLADRKDIVTAVDWTDFDKNDQPTIAPKIALHLITGLSVQHR